MDHDGWEIVETAELTVTYRKGTVPGQIFIAILDRPDHPLIAKISDRAGRKVSHLSVSVAGLSRMPTDAEIDAVVAHFLPADRYEVTKRGTVTASPIVHVWASER